MGTEPGLSSCNENEKYFEWRRTCVGSSSILSISTQFVVTSRHCSRYWSGKVLFKCLVLDIDYVNCCYQSPLFLLLICWSWSLFLVMICWSWSLILVLILAVAQSSSLSNFKSDIAYSYFLYHDPEVLQNYMSPLMPFVFTLLSITLRQNWR